MQLSQKQKIFFGFFLAISKFTFYFEYIQKRDDPHSSSIFELTDSEERR